MRDSNLTLKQAFDEIPLEQVGECLIWRGALTDKGYGSLQYHHRHYRAHRLAWQFKFGEVPPRLDHRCRVRACINLDHLRPVTQSQNLQNLSPTSTRGRAGIRGVSWDKQTEKWRVLVTLSGRSYSGGRFADLDVAAAAARNLRNSLFTHNEADRA